MPIVNIVKEFTYQHPDGYKELIPPGSYDLSDELANSRYVRAHSDDPMRPQIQPGMPQHEAAMAHYNAAQAARGTREDQLAEQASVNARSEFRRSDQGPQARRPNQRPSQEQPEPDPAQVEQEEFEEHTRVAESMGQKLPEDAAPRARRRNQPEQPQQSEGQQPPAEGQSAG